MRQERTVQATIFEVFAQHEIGCELKVMSQWLDGQRGLIGLVAGDLRRQGVRQTGRRGLPAESVLRCALLKQQRQLSYEELAFHLEDSASFRAFARLPLAWSPKTSVLQRTISALRSETWEAVNRALVASAKQEKLETGAVVRIDSTVTTALMHHPSDSAILWDAVRVMSRLLRQAAKLPGAAAIRWHDRRRLAKRCAVDIQYSRGKDTRCRLYRKLIAATHATRAALQRAATRLSARRHRGRALARPGRPLPAADRAHPRPERAPGAAWPGGAGKGKVGQPVRATRRHYRQGWPRRAVWPQAQPCHRQEWLDPRSRHQNRQSGRCRALSADARPPHRPLRHPAPADGGRRRYASRDNLDQAKARGASDVAFHKKRGLAVADMAKSAWVYRRLRNFRAGIEAGISCFKRAYGGGRCTWRGLDHFKAYVCPPWWPTTWCCSPASNRDSAPTGSDSTATEISSIQLALPCTFVESASWSCCLAAKSPIDAPHASRLPPFIILKNRPLW